MAIERKLRLVQLDEFVISKQTMPAFVWTNKYTNITYDLSKLQTRAKAVLIAVSREYGLDLIQVYNNSINTTKFKIFLHELRRKFWADDILLMMDNLSIHKNGEVRRLIEELGFHYTYTLVYSP